MRDVINSCILLCAQVLQVAQAVPAAPIAQIQQDWQSLVAQFVPIVTACNTGALGNDPTFFQQYPSLRQALLAPNAKLGADLGLAGYCFPSATCLPPYTTSEQP